MRRALSILLVLLFGAGPLTFAFSLSDDILLPACCRRHGAHHCAMDSQQAQNGSGGALKGRVRCQDYPPHPNARTSSYTSASVSSQVEEHAPREPGCSRPSCARSISIHLRTPVLRGPPATHLS